MSRKNKSGLTDSNDDYTNVKLPLIFLNYMESLNEPCGIKDRTSKFIYANKAYLKLLNLPNDFNIEGRLDSEVPAATADYASLFQAHDRLVETTLKRRSSLEIHPFGKDQQLSAYFFDKTPFPDENKNIIGTFFHGRKAEHLSLRFYIEGGKAESIILTKPDDIFSDFQWLVVFYLRSHLTAKEIAMKLNRSVGYIRNVIAKIYEDAGVTSTAMLIDFLRSNGWHRYVPEKLLAHHHHIIS